MLLFQHQWLQFSQACNSPFWLLRPSSHPTKQPPPLATTPTAKIVLLTHHHHHAGRCLRCCSKPCNSAKLSFRVLQPSSHGLPLLSTDHAAICPHHLRRWRILHHQAAWLCYCSTGCKKIQPWASNHCSLLASVPKPAATLFPSLTLTATKQHPLPPTCHLQGPPHSLVEHAARQTPLSTPRTLSLLASSVQCPSKQPQTLPPFLTPTCCEHHPPSVACHCHAA